MKRRRLNQDICPVARSLDVLGDWWTLLIVRDALRGTRRFSDFQRDLGLAKNILSVRLQMLVEVGVLETRPSPERADHKEYHVTQKGRDLTPVLLALRDWSLKYLSRPDTAADTAVQLTAPQPLPEPAASDH